MKKRFLRIESDYAYVPLTKGYESKVDLCDIDLVKNYNWRYAQGYARCTINIDGKWHDIALHQLLLNEYSLIIDHEDGDGLNNTRKNIRIATFSDNSRNKKPKRDKLLKNKYKGITWRKDLKYAPWGAQIEVNGKNVWLGYHKSPEEAAKAYDEAAIKYFGEFAFTNQKLGLL